MSKFKVLAVAIAATLVASTAYATTVTFTVGASTENSNQFDTTADAAVVPVFTIKSDISDTYLSRTAPYNVRVKLSSGKIAAVPTITSVGTSTATLIAGTGGIGQTEFLVKITPAIGGAAVGDGFSVSTLTVNNLNGTLGSGGSLSVTGQAEDPTGGNTLVGSTFSKVVYKTVEGVDVIFTATTTQNVIDVGQPSSKKFFTTAGGAIGSGTAAILFNAGKVEIQDTSVPVLTTTPWLQNTGTAKFTISTTDGNFNAFVTSGTNTGKIYLSDISTCATTVTGSTATVSGDGKSAVTGDVLLSDLSAGQPFDAFVCFDNNSVTDMVPSNVKAKVVVSPGAGFTDFTSAEATLAPMAYNGPVVTVDSFNPASNPYIVSFLRISNTSGTTGRVTIKPTCDDGTSPGTAVISSLAGGKSILVEAGHIENGGGSVNLGAGSCASGKTRLQVVGEVGSLKVQNFMRHNTSIGVINNNVNNEK